MKVFRNSLPKKAFFLSLSLHILPITVFFAIFQTPDLLKEKTKLKQGAVFSLSSLSSGSSQVSRNNETEKSSGQTGTKTIDEEIQEFQNCLSYPPLALEQRLEDQCQFRVTVAENGSLEKLVVIKPCRYSVFDSQVRSQLADWKFTASKGQEIYLPIRFRLDVRD